MFAQKGIISSSPLQAAGLSNGVKVKICGITNLADALAAQSLGASALGFVFYSKSPRYIPPKSAQRIISQLNKKIKKIGVFVNADSDLVKKTARLCGLDMLQFHGDETPDFCRKFNKYKIIKAFRIKNEDSLKDIGKYPVDYYLFDTFKKDSFGGTGSNFNWDILKGLKLTKPFFLSGGLNPKNIVSAVQAARADWVDASSGVEAKPGIKDKRLLRDFIDKARSL
ncbi:MAG: phosphoribosylanthranilate isomerase [Candidatus Omnitrophota bacterium]|nr:phosphoribosylanthranilate isomerase [Candidatus Omnitrophota bacterium]